MVKITVILATPTAKEEFHNQYFYVHVPISLPGVREVSVRK
jgi:hypothetical protein